MEQILHQAEQLEKEYDWLAAADSYEKVLSLLPENDFSSKGKINERLAYARYHAAFQAESSSDFRERMRQSVEEYGKAGEVLVQIAPARSVYCRAMARYSDFWFAEDTCQKKRSLDDCRSLLKEALDGFAAAGDVLGYGRAFHSLAFCLWDRGSFSESLRESKEIAEEGVRYGQTAVTKLSETDAVDELAWAYTMTSRSMISHLDVFEERKPEFLSFISEYLKKAGELRDRIEDVYFQYFLDRALFTDGENVKGDSQIASKWAHNLLPHAERAKDHRLLAGAYWVLNWVTANSAVTEEDPDKKKEQLNLAIRFAEESIRQNLLIHRYDQASLAYSYWLVESYYSLAELEASVEEKRALLKRAVEAGRKGNEYAQLSRSLDAIWNIYHVLSKALYFLSKTERDVDEKKRLLGEALELLKKRIEILSKLVPPSQWVHGAGQNYLALVKTDLAEMEESDEQKRRLLEEAVSSMEICIATCTRYVEAVAVKSLQWFFGALGWYHDWFGEVLDRLYALTKDQEIINKAIGVSQGAVQVYQKAGMPSRVAEAHWRAARLHDRLGEYVKSAEEFELASKNYQLVAESIPQLQEFYQEHALYMQAWSEIEKARHHHARQEYGSAEEHFDKAASLHRSLKQWSYLSPNYSAWNRVENAEELSRNEKSEDAIKVFEEASKLFSEAKKSLQAQLSKIEEADEKQMASSMIKASDLRQEYCDGRIALEKAKVLDRTGDHLASSEKYGSAAEVFEKISETLESEQERREFRFLVSLSRAWQKMMLGDARTSPESYLEASVLFEQASKESNSEVANLLALGHSRFCKALEAGTRFADTGNIASQTVAMKNLEVAAKYYVKAGFQRASEYAKATGLLFDAYVHMDNAKEEKDPEKKTKLYLIAEKVLQTSAGSFMKAEHLEKREQVLRLLEKVREERELAISIAEVLHTPPIVSTTTSFAAPTPTSEEAVGSERFEHADVRANLIIRERELRTGEDLSIELELVNAGKGFALLTKVTEIIPKGFELAEKTDNCRVDDGCLDLKGKRLDPLKTEEVKLVLKPTVRGRFSLKPTVLYLDENGKYKTHEPESVTITVRELGIKSWIKGER